MFSVDKFVHLFPDNGGNTPLHLSVRQKTWDMTFLLIKHATGKELLHKNNAGKRIFDYCNEDLDPEFKRHNEVVKSLSLLAAISLMSDECPQEEVIYMIKNTANVDMSYNDIVREIDNIQLKSSELKRKCERED